MSDVSAAISSSLTWKVVVVLAIKCAAVLFAMFVFARFSALVDAELYLKGAYTADPHFRTRLLDTLASALNRFGGVWFAHFVFGVISTSGLLYYFFTGGHRWVLALMLFLPSSFVWTSIVGKEALFVGGFTISLVIWSRFALSELERRDFLLLILALAVCGILRPHYAAVIIWLFVSVFVVKRLESKSWPIVLVIWLLGALLTYCFVWTDLLERGIGGISPVGRASRFELFRILPGTEVGFERFKMFVLLGVLIGITGPLPQEVYSRPEFLPYAVEGVLILLAPYMIYRCGIARLSKWKKLFRYIFWWCLAPALLAVMIIHAPFGVLNPGSATRWRTNFEPLFYMAPLLLLFQFIDREPHENCSLPH